MVWVVADGLAGVVAEEQLQSRLLGKGGDLNRLEAVQVVPSRGEENAARKSRRAGFEADRAIELGRVVEVIVDDQGVGAPIQILKGGAELVIGRLFDGIGPQSSTDVGESLSERFGGVDPEDAAGVVVLVAVDILDGELGLSDPAHAGKSGESGAERRSGVEERMESV
jgi:hypothetical protein